MTEVDAAIAAVDDVIGEARADLEALVRIPSISADPDHFADVQASADATVELLRGHGLENVRTAGVEGSQPFVIGEWMHAGPDVPTVLVVRASRRATARASSRTGRAIRSSPTSATAVSTGAAPPTTRPARSPMPTPSAPGSRARARSRATCGCWWRAKRRSDRPTLHSFLTAHLEELRSDVLVLADAGNWQVGVPGLTYSLRGLAAADIELRALDGPQHSGMTGGALPDPVMALARVLASLVDEHGDVAFDGGFAGLTEPTREGTGGHRRLRRPARALRARVRRAARASSSSATHRSRCTNGSGCGRASPSSGSTGIPIKGSSNQIVARASARVSMRLGPGQDPERVLAGLRAHVERERSLGTRSARSPALEGAPAWQTDPTGPAFDAARRALHAGFGVEPVLMGVGGSIPFVGPFADAFGGIPALLMGPDDPHSNIHGEDESLHLADWRSLIRSEVFLLDELSRLGVRVQPPSAGSARQHASTARAATRVRPTRVKSMTGFTFTPAGPASMIATGRPAW